ncbi:Uma2 family endonuclease [Streptomyces sp. NPDC001100]
MEARTSTGSESGPDGEWASRRPVPPPEGWTADDLDRIPGLPPHTELMDGTLVFRSPQTAFQGRCLRLLENGLLEQAPDGLDVDQAWHKPEDVLLAVEVVSADSLERDRETKPRKYAAAGVRHCWRVEQDENKGLPVVHVYELDPATRSYGLAGIFHDRLRLSVPFDIEIDLTVINRRRP